MLTDYIRYRGGSSCLPGADIDERKFKKFRDI